VADRLGIAAVSAATPLVSARIFEKWFTLTVRACCCADPAATALLFFVADRTLRRLPVRLAQGNEYGAWVPFGCMVGIISLAFYGLAYSLFPYLVVDRMTIWEAASAPESLMFIFVGAAVVLPAIIGYTVFVYRVFRGKPGARRCRGRFPASRRSPMQSASVPSAVSRGRAAHRPRPGAGAI
jgi:cytochrome bd ubiquinol oxidase subunit II